MVTAVLIGMLYLSNGPVLAQTVTYTGSALYSNGDYIFVDRTSSWTLANGLSVSWGRANIAATVPVIFQNSPWVSYSTFGALPSGGPQNGAVVEQRGRRQSGGTDQSTHGSEGNRGEGRSGGNGGEGGSEGGGGNGSDDISAKLSASGGTDPVVVVDTVDYSEAGLGDPSVRLTVTAIDGRGASPSVQLAFGIKAPLASTERGFGTGAWDVGAGISASKRFGKQFLLADVMYWHMGDMDDLELRDPISYSIAVGTLIGAKTGMMASFTGATEIIEGASPPRQAGLATTYLFSSRVSIMVSAMTGLSESSPDVSFSLGLAAKLR